MWDYITDEDNWVEATVKFRVGTPDDVTQVLRFIETQYGTVMNARGSAKVRYTWERNNDLPY